MIKDRNVAVPRLASDLISQSKLDLEDNPRAYIAGTGTTAGNRYFQLPKIATADLPAAAAGNLGAMAFDTTLGYAVYSTGSAWSSIASSGGTLDAAYDSGGAGAGRTVTVDSGAIVFTGAHASNDTFQITNSNAVATGDLLQFSHANAAGKDINGTGGAWSVLSTGVATFAGITMTGNLDLGANTTYCKTLVADDAGDVAMTIDAAGSGTITLGATSTGAITLSRATTLSLGATITAGGLTVTAGGATITAGGLSVVAGGGTVAGGFTVSTGNLGLTNGNFTIATGNLTLSSGNAEIDGLLDVVGPGASSADLVDVTRDNSALGGNGLHVSMGTATVAGHALAIDWGGAGTGDSVNINQTNNLAGSALLVTGAGTRTDRLIKITDSSGAAGAETVYINKTAGAAAMLLLDNDGASDSDTVEIDHDGQVVGRALYAHSAEWTGKANEGMVDLETSGTAIPAGQMLRVVQGCSGQHAAQILGSCGYFSDGATAPGAGTSYAVVITASSIEALSVPVGKVNLAELLELGAGLTSAAGDVTLTTGNLVVSGGLVDFTQVASSAEDVVDITRVNTATDGHGLHVSMGTAAVPGDGVLVAYGNGASTGAAFHATFAGASVGDGLLLNMTNAVGSNGIDVTGAGTRTAPLVILTDASGAAGAETFKIVKSAGAADAILIDNNGAAGSDSIQVDHDGNVSGRVLYGHAAEWTGTASEGMIHLVTSGTAIPAGQMLRIVQGCTGQHAAAIDGTIFFSDAATAPGAGTSYLLTLDATNIEAMHIKTGKLVCDEQVVLGGGAVLEDNDALGIGTASAESTLQSNGTNTLWTISSGEVQIGTPGTNHATFSTAGLLTFVGTARRTKTWFIPAGDFVVHAGTPAMTQVGAGLARGWAFDQASDETITAQVIVPDNIVEGAYSIYLHWTSATNAGNCVWDTTTLSVAEGETLVAAGTTNSVTDAAPGTANFLCVTASMATASLTAGETLIVSINRDANNGGDTLADDAILLGVELRFTADRI